jgi:hypothetical protein
MLVGHKQLKPLRYNKRKRPYLQLQRYTKHRQLPKHRQLHKRKQVEQAGLRLHLQGGKHLCQQGKLLLFLVNPTLQLQLLDNNQ